MQMITSLQYSYFILTSARVTPQLCSGHPGLQDIMTFPVSNHQHFCQFLFFCSFQKMIKFLVDGSNHSDDVLLIL